MRDHSHSHRWPERVFTANVFTTMVDRQRAGGAVEINPCVPFDAPLFSFVRDVVKSVEKWPLLLSLYYFPY